MENNTKKSQKLSTNEVAMKLIDNKRAPAMAVSRKPNLPIKRVTSGPNMYARDMYNEPVHAEKKIKRNDAYVMYYGVQEATTATPKTTSIKE